MCALVRLHSHVCSTDGWDARSSVILWLPCFVELCSMLTMSPPMSTKHYALFIYYVACPLVSHYVPKLCLQLAEI